MHVKTAMAPGDLYWGEDKVASGSEQSGHRIWLVVSRAAINGGNTVVVVPLSTKLEKANKYPAFCIRLPRTEIIPEPGQTASVDCAALCHQIRVFDKNNFTKKYGKLSLSAVPSVQLGLAYVFNLQ